MYGETFGARKADNFFVMNNVRRVHEENTADEAIRGLVGEYDEVYRGEYISVRHVYNRRVGDWVYAHEACCNGELVGVLPYYYDEFLGVDWFLLRQEYVPCWNMFLKNLCILSGQCDVEGLSPVEIAVKELEEESGYVVKEDALLSLGKSFVCKGMDSIYHLFAVDVGAENVKWVEPSGDGSRGEQLAECIWVSEVKFFTMDPMLAQAYCRFKSVM